MAAVNGSSANYYYDGDLLMTVDAEFVDFHFFYDASGSPIGFACIKNGYDPTSHYEFEYY